MEEVAVNEAVVDTPFQAVAHEIRNNLETEAPKLTLARLGMDILPESILATRDCTRVAHIRVLDLRHNALQLLPSELFLCLHQLQEVDVSENHLSHISESIGLLTGLRKLNLRRNQLENLPDGLFRLHSLKELDVGHNVLACLPTAIGALRRLRRLDLPDNQLEEIPEEAGLLDALEHVDIAGNPIRHVPLHIQRLQTKGELLRSKAHRRNLVERALRVRGSVRAAFAEEALGDNV